MSNNDSKSVDINALAAAFQQGMAAAIEQAKPKEFDYAEWMNRPENRDPFLDLKRPVLQHGQPIQIRGASADTIKHLNELEPGDYIGGRVQVRVAGQAPHEKVFINYPADSVTDRMHNQTLFSSFSDLVKKISEEQKARSAK